MLNKDHRWGWKGNAVKTSEVSACGLTSDFDLMNRVAYWWESVEKKSGRKMLFAFQDANTRQKKDSKEQIKRLLLTPFCGIFSGSFKSNSRNSWWPKPLSNPSDQQAMKVSSQRQDRDGMSTEEDFQLGEGEQLVGLRSNWQCGKQ